MIKGLGKALEVALCVSKGFFFALINKADTQGFFFWSNHVQPGAGPAKNPPCLPHQHPSPLRFEEQILFNKKAPFAPGLRQAGKDQRVSGNIGLYRKRRKKKRNYQSPGHTPLKPGNKGFGAKQAFAPGLFEKKGPGPYVFKNFFR